MSTPVTFSSVFPAFYEFSSVITQVQFASILLSDKEITILIYFFRISTSAWAISKKYLAYKMAASCVDVL